MTAAKSGRGLSQRAVVAASAEYASGERGFFFFVGVQAIEVNAEQVRFQRRDQVIQCFAEEQDGFSIKGHSGLVQPGFPSSFEGTCQIFVCSFECRLHATQPSRSAR